MLDEGVKVWEKFKSAAKPEPTLVFVDQQRPQSDLTVNPVWKNRIGSGFSNPISVTIALRNLGTGAATNVEVYLLYPPGVVNVKQSSGRKTVPAVLGDVTLVTGYENAETFSIARIDPSPIANIFEKKLQLQLRFRQTLGVPARCAGRTRRGYQRDRRGAIHSMTAQRDALLAARFRGVRTVEIDGRRITYASDAEITTAITDLERRIAVAGDGGRRRRILTSASKGL